MTPSPKCVPPPAGRRGSTTDSARAPQRPAPPRGARPAPRSPPRFLQPAWEAPEHPWETEIPKMPENRPLPRPFYFEWDVLKITWLKCFGNTLTWKLFLQLGASRGALFPSCKGMGIHPVMLMPSYIHFVTSSRAMKGITIV